MLGIAITVASVVLLSGCVPTDPVVTPVPEASSTPVFASEDDALAAAEAAYAAYVAVSDRVAQAGGDGSQDFASVVTPDWLEHEVDSAATLKKSGLHQVGESEVLSFALQQLDQSQVSSASVTTYVCIGLHDVRYLDAAGSDKTPASRPDAVPLEVSFESQKGKPDSLLVAGNDPWAGDDFC